MDFRKVASDTVVSSGRLLAKVLSGILLIPIITKLMGADKYGIWVVVFAIIGVISTTAGLHLHGALIRYISTEEMEGQTFTDTLILTVLAGIVATSAFFILDFTIGIFPLNYAAEIERGLIIGAGIYIPLTMLFAFQVNYPRARQRVKKTELLLLVRQLLETVVLVVVLLLSQSLVTAIWSIVAVLAILNVLLFIGVAPSLVVSPDPKRFGKYLRYGLPMLPKELSNRILTHADKFLILYLLSPAATGIYAVAYGVCSMLRSLSSPLNSTLYPSVSSAWDAGEIEQLQLLYWSILKGYSLVGIPAVVGLSLLSGPLLQLLSTPEVARQGHVLIPILSVGFLMRGYDNSLVYVLNADEETKKIGLIIIVATGVNLVLNVILIPTVGLLGAATATVVAQGLITGYVSYQAWIRIKFSMPVEAFGKSCIAAGVMAITLLALPTSLAGPVKLALFPPVGIATYSVVIVLIGGINRGELDLIRGAVSEIIDSRK